MTATRRPPRPSPRPQPREVDPEFTRLVEEWLSDVPDPDEAARDEPVARPERREDPPSRVSIGLVGVLAFIFVFGALFGLAAFHSVLVQNQLRLDRLTSDVEREQARYQDLRLEYGQAAAPYRILAQASARGMLQSNSKVPLQAVLPEQGKLTAPNPHPFGAVSNFVPPVVSAPPSQTTVSATTLPASTAPTGSTAPTSTVPTASTAPTSTVPTASTVAKSVSGPTTKAGT